MKELIKKIKKRIKQSNIAKLIKFRSTIKDLENKIGDLEKEKQRLYDKINTLNLDLEDKEELENKVFCMEMVIASRDRAIKNRLAENEQLQKDKLQLQNEMFEVKMELASANIQKEEYEAQIKELKSDRYLVKKVRAGRTPNTNKTKISRPMSGNVVKFMRSEHE